MNFFPLCTAMVWPTISGVIVDRRDHVLRIFFSFRAFMASMAFIRWSSMNGPFLIERAMLLLPLHDELIGALVIARLVTQGRNAPQRHRVIPLHSPFTATMRVIHRVHDDAADCRPDSHMPLAPCFSNRDVLMVEIADLTDR